MLRNRIAGKVPFPVSILLAALVGAAVILIVFPPPSRPTEAKSLPKAPVAEAVSLDRDVPSFQLLNQEGEKVTREDLAGEVWIAGFVYTRCHGTCPMVSSAMARLRDELPQELRLVSFSVDPKHDTPEVLKEYASYYKADVKNWMFLTGEPEQIQRISQDGFLLAVEENKDPRTQKDDLVIHSNRLVLVDRSGKARGTYDSSDPAAMDQLQRAAQKLLKDRS